MAANRVNFVGGNWKCNKMGGELVALTQAICNFDLNGVDVVVAPTPIYLSAILEASKGCALQVSSQNVSATGTGAYTGEIAPAQLTDLGIKWTIIGHSERRAKYGESDEVVQTKVKNALGNGLKVIACFGETLQHRQEGVTMDVVLRQVKAICDGVDKAKWGDVVLAYEPVWAIGTGKTCGKEDAQDVCGKLRSWLNNNVSSEVAQSTRIIYGGSVKPKNCQQLIAMTDIDGFLVGGASLKAELFEPIVTSARSGRSRL